MKLLRIVLNGEEHPNYTIKKAFEEQFNCETVWFEQYSPLQLNAWIVDRFKTHQYDAVFMQLQRGGVIFPTTAAFMAQKCPVFNWTGDVREDLSAYEEIAKYVITLFSNTHDVDVFKSKGYRSDYLQVGYDHHYYNHKGERREPMIVFCGSNYPEIEFPLSQERREMVIRLQKEFPKSFRLYGNSWVKSGIASNGVLGNIGEAMAYNQTMIAISLSHFNYGRYYSDRLLRIMACGALAMSHDYKDRHMDFAEDEMAIWHDLDDLVAKCRHYLDPKNHHEMRTIADKGMKKVESSCKWSNRVSEFKKLIEKYS